MLRPVWFAGEQEDPELRGKKGRGLRTKKTQCWKSSLKDSSSSKYYDRLAHLENNNTKLTESGVDTDEGVGEISYSGNLQAAIIYVIAIFFR